MTVNTAKGDAPTAQNSGWGDYAEDATGFGGVEWRTARDLMIRPRAVLDAYLTRGPSGGGLYARPTRFYLALCGVLMFYLFLIGGNQRLLDGMPPPLLDAMAAWSGRTRAAFAAGADGWLSIMAVPLLSLFYTVGVAPLIKWWGGHRWRLAVRATLAMFCAWTVPFLLLGPLPYIDPYRLAGSLFMYVALIVAFVRMGRGVWWRTPAGAAGKSVLVALAISLAAPIGMVALLGLTAVAMRLAS